MAEKQNVAGMDESQRAEDSKGFKTSIEMVTGGALKDIEGMTGPEVCAPYGKDPLGKTKGGK